MQQSSQHIKSRRNPSRRRESLVVSALALAVLSSCALRQRAAGDYQVVRYGANHYVYPPGLNASDSGPPSEANVEISGTGLSDAARGCAVSESGLRIGSNGAPQRRLVANLRLTAAAAGEFEPSPEDSVSPKLRSAFEKLAAADCLQPRDVRPAARQVIENLPLRFDELLPHHYSYFRGGSSIDLSSGSRLKVQEAIFEDTVGAQAQTGGLAAQPDSQDTPGRPAGPLDGYLGTVTSYYDASEAQDGSVALRLASVDSDVPKDAADRAMPALSPSGLGSLKARYVRLLFLGLLVQQDTQRKAVLLGTEGSEELERMSRAVLENPVGLCEAAAPGPAAKCFEFSGRISTEVEIRVRVNDEYRHVLLGTPLKAVAPPEAGRDATILAKLKLHRRYNGRLVPVRLPRDDQDTLALPLLADDEIEW